MKKYITPRMDIRIFNNLAETGEVTSSTEYVEALKSMPDNNKAQVQLDAMTKITQFAF